jgi:hypothetical protein
MLLVDRPDLSVAIWSGLFEKRHLDRASQIGIPWYDKLNRPGEVLLKLQRGEPDEAGVVPSAVDSRRRHYVAVLHKYNENISAAAKAEKVSRSTFQRNIHPAWALEHMEAERRERDRIEGDAVAQDAT